MSNARDRILKKLRQAGGMSASPPVVAFREPMVEDWGSDEKVSRFIEQLSASRVEVYQTCVREWVEQLRLICEQQHLDNLLIDIFSPTGQAMTDSVSAGFVWPELISYQRDIEEWKDDLFGKVQASFTIARGGVVETGSLIVAATQTEPRLMTIVPPVHIVLVNSNTLYTTFAEAVLKQQWEHAGMPGFAQLISGPGRSPDLEQLPLYGVQGQSKLIVLMLNLHA